MTDEQKRNASGASRLSVGLGISLRNALAIATGIYHCMTAEREMEEERVICETWLTEEPKGIYAFARISRKTYFRPGYFDMSKDDWVMPNLKGEVLPTDKQGVE